MQKKHCRNCGTPLTNPLLRPADRAVGTDANYNESYCSEGCWKGRRWGPTWTLRHLGATQEPQWQRDGSTTPLTVTYGMESHPSIYGAAAVVLNPDALYLTDDGRILHGRCCGVTARTTGRDLSGAPVEELTEDDLAAMALLVKTQGFGAALLLECEDCRRRSQQEEPGE